MIIIHTVRFDRVTDGISAVRMRCCLSFRRDSHYSECCEADAAQRLQYGHFDSQQHPGKHLSCGWMLCSFESVRLQAFRSAWPLVRNGFRSIVAGPIDVGRFAKCQENHVSPSVDTSFMELRLRGYGRTA